MGYVIFFGEVGVETKKEWIGHFLNIFYCEFAMKFWSYHH
ncbi:hypothetical protein MGWOODY_Tha2340 [hydrothermal vent metagenome]|uniref:Uncharacterized protein n=1 Tax=hydrothermal vent metagenome TaxID=652676 RepID=A0A160TCL4_9ZZZZ